MDSLATAAASDAVAALRTTVVRRAALLASPLPRLCFFFLKADDGVHAAIELLPGDDRFRGLHGGPTRRLPQRRRPSAPATAAPLPQPRQQMLRWRASPTVFVDLDPRAAAAAAAAAARLAAFISAPVALGHSTSARLTSARRWGVGRGGCGRVSGASRPDRGRRRGPRIGRRAGGRYGRRRGGGMRDGDLRPRALLSAGGGGRQRWRGGRCRRGGR